MVYFGGIGGIYIYNHGQMDGSYDARNKREVIKYNSFSLFIKGLCSVN